MTRADALLALRQDLANIPDLDLQDEPGQLLRCSRDAYDYSPAVSYTHLTLPTILRV